MQLGQYRIPAGYKVVSVKLDETTGETWITVAANEVGSDVNHWVSLAEANAAIEDDPVKEEVSENEPTTFGHPEDDGLKIIRRETIWEPPKATIKPLGANMPSGLFFKAKSMEAETTQLIGQEWVRPNGYWSSDDVPFAGLVAVQTADRHWILLANVYKVMDGLRVGSVIRTFAKISELAVVDL